MQIIDADGHVNDHACGEEIAAYMPKGNQIERSANLRDGSENWFLSQVLGHLSCRGAWFDSGDFPGSLFKGIEKLAGTATNI